MYKQFFGLRESPFSASPDPRFLVSTREIEETFASLTYGIQQRRGFILLTGEVGTGKTTILNMFLEWLRDANVATAFIFNPRLSVVEFMDFMMTDFGIPCESGLKSQKLIRLNQWLLGRYRSNETAVLIVDEAQNLSAEVLEEIRLLTNLETAREKLLQIVISGQPELEYKLNHFQLRQLKQRITLRCKTCPLTSKQTVDYINQRLRIAGWNDGVIFSPPAVDAIHHFSRGIPRVINLLCDHALINSYVDGRKIVATNMIDSVAKEFGLDEPATPAATSSANGNCGQPKASPLLNELAVLIDRLRRAEVGEGEPR